MKSGEELDAFHRIVNGASGIEVKRERRPDGPADIRFIELADPLALANFLGRIPAVDQARSAITQLRDSVGSQVPWIAEVMEDIAAAWAVKKEGFPGLEPGDVVLARKFIDVLASFERGDHLRGWDMRTFSHHACGDSKAVEVAKTRLVKALRRRFELPEVSPREVLASLGVEKFPQPVLIRGHLALPQGVEVVADPYIGLPPDWAGAFSPSNVPPYVLVIENLASFNRHAREVKDGGLLVFSGGFPSCATLTAIKRLDKRLAGEVPFFHWGDTDRHGFLIHEHIAGALGRPLVMHMMQHAVGQEQEGDDPCSPLATTIPRQMVS
jgi:hypothetical protein